VKQSRAHSQAGGALQELTAAYATTLQHFNISLNARTSTIAKSQVK
jgi:hypothetical protein